MNEATAARACCYCAQMFEPADQSAVACASCLSDCCSNCGAPPTEACDPMCRIERDRDEASQAVADRAAHAPGVAS